MQASDVKQLLDRVESTGVMQIAVKHRPRLLSDNGSAFVSQKLERYLTNKEDDTNTRRPQQSGKSTEEPKEMHNINERATVRSLESQRESLLPCKRKGKHM